LQRWLDQAQCDAKVVQPALQFVFHSAPSGSCRAAILRRLKQIIALSFPARCCAMAMNCYWIKANGHRVLKHGPAPAAQAARQRPVAARSRH
jgi:hypothetical protein